MTWPSLSGLRDWQELIGAGVSLFIGVAAIAISVFALRASRRQVDLARAQLAQADAQDQARRLARERAMRASLSPILSTYCAWAMGLTQHLRELPADPLTVKARLAFEAPPAPPELAWALVQVIEVAQDEAVFARVAKIIGNTQVISARLAMIRETRIGLTAHNIDSFLLDVVVLYAQVASLFEYARFAADTAPTPLPWEAVTNAVDSLGLHGPRFSQLYEMIGRLKDERDPEAI
jgi:hypothetical protein